MDGLECSEISTKEMDKLQNRLDAEFYRKNNLKTASLISGQHHKTIEELDVITDCSAFYPGVVEIYNFEKKGIPFIRVNEITSLGLVSINDATAFLPKSFLDENASTMIRCLPEDIVIAKGGNTLAKTGIVSDDFSDYATCRDIIVLRTRNLQVSFRYYLWAYLQSYYGQTLLWRTASQTGQPHLTIDYIKAILVPLFSESFYESIKFMYQQSQAIHGKANRLYQSAELLLLSSLNLDNFTPSTENTSIKSFSQVDQSGRMDAEYYQRKYDEIEERLWKYDPNLRTLSQITSYIFTGQYAEEYYSLGDYDNLRYFIRGTDISNGYVEKDKTHCINPEGFDKFVRTGDIVTGRVGTIGNWGVVDDTLNGALCSDNILCLHLPDEYMPEVYALYFNNALTKKMITRMARGSVQQRLNQETLKDVLVPLIKKEAQVQIAIRIRKSFALREQSKSLLKVATRAVEIAIEQDESAAIAYLREHTEGDA